MTSVQRADSILIASSNATTEDGLREAVTARIFDGAGEMGRDLG